MSKKISAKDSHTSGDTHDHTEITGTTTNSETKRGMDVFNLQGFSLPAYDTINITYPTTSTETYTYLLAAATVAVIDVTYSNASKDDITQVTRST